MLTARAGWAVVIGAWLLPYLTWMRLTSPDPHESVTQTPMWLFALLGLVVLSVTLWASDRWLGAFAAYWTCWAIPALWPTGFETVYITVIGVVALMAVRQIPIASHARIYQGLVIVGAIQVSYLIGQRFGVDLLWTPVQGTPLKIVGTLGNPSHVAGLIAMLSPIAPLWVLPYFALGLWLTHSGVAMIAALIGVMVAHRATLSWKWAMVPVIATAILILYTDNPQGSVQTRVEILRQAWMDMSWVSAVVGHGPGAWIAHPKLIWGEIFLQAHNEYLQLFYEGGIIAAGLVAGWLWSHRVALARSAALGSVAAIAVLAVPTFVLHLAVPGLIAVVLLGMATAEREDSCAYSP